MSFLTETFTAANGTSLDDVSGWDKHPVFSSSAAEIQANRVVGTAASGLWFNTTAAAGADHYAEADLLFKSMDMPYSEEIAERMKKMMPPQLQDQGGEDESPEVQQVKQQASQVIQQLQQQLEAAHAAMQEAEQEAKVIEQKANDTETKNALEAKRVEIEQYKAETDRLKVELDAAQKQQDDERIQMVEEAVAHLIGATDPGIETEQQEPAPAGFLTPEGTE